MEGPQDLNEDREGWKFEPIRPGDATNYPKKGCSVRVHYVLKLPDGTIVDSSRDRGRPHTFKLGAGQAVKGWDRIVPLMSKGQIVRLTLSPELAYGDDGYPPIIPPGQALIYEIELLGFWSEAVHRAA